MKLAFLLVVGVVTLYGCEKPPPAEDDERIVELEAEITQQQEFIDAILFEVSGPPAKRAPGAACPSDINTWVHSSEGTDCTTYQAHIRGWSIQCVDGCDATARLDEATASASATCKAFCEEKECPSHRYVAPSQCATHRCLTASRRCPAQCPDKESCFLEQFSTGWNCFCDETEG